MVPSFSPGRCRRMQAVPSTSRFDSNQDEPTRSARRNVVHVVGELDAATAPALARRLTSDATIEVLDLSQVTFIDAAGLRAVLAGLQRCGPTLQLASPSPCVVRLFQLVELAHLVDLHAAA